MYACMSIYAVCFFAMFCHVWREKIEFRASNVVVELFNKLVDCLMAFIAQRFRQQQIQHSAYC